MSFYRLAARAALLVPLLLAAPAAQAGIGDLLVAPTRVVLNGSRGSEIILNNIGEDVATYRVSVELRRMTPDGMLNDVADPSAAEQLAQSLGQAVIRQGAAGKLLIEPRRAFERRVHGTPPYDRVPDKESCSIHSRQAATSRPRSRDVGN